MRPSDLADRPQTGGDGKHAEYCGHPVSAFPAKAKSKNPQPMGGRSAVMERVNEWLSGCQGVKVLKVYQYASQSDLGIVAGK